MSELPPRYEVLKTLGSGAMGKVLLARDSELGRLVAVKLLLTGAGAGDELLRRFSREARIMTLAAHPNLIQVLGFETSVDPPFLVMEVVEGVSLMERVRDRGPMPLAEVVRLVEELAGALDALHVKGIIHRDIKPGNIMLRARDGSAVLMDLGLASYSEFTLITQTGQVLGTPRYLPPEVVLGGTWSGRGDLFQLGTIAFESLSGIHMVQAKSFDELPTTIAQGRWAEFPDKIGPVPEHVEAAIRRMTSVDPKARFDSGAQFAAALSLSASSAGPPNRVTPRARKAAKDLTVGMAEGGSAGSRLLSGSSSAAAPPPRRPGRVLALGLGLAAALAAGVAVGPRRAPARPVPGGELESPLASGFRLAEDHRLALVATRAAKVRWAARPELETSLEPGERFLAVPDGLPRPWVLAWEDGSGSGEVRLAPAGLLQKGLERLVDAAAEDPTGRYLETRPPRACPELRQPFQTLLGWLPDLLADPELGVPARVRLLEAWRRAARSALQEHLLGLAAVPLALPPGAVGSQGAGLPAWPGAYSTDLPLTAEGGEGEGNALGRELAVAAGKALMGGAYRQAADALVVRWPELPVRPGRRLALAADQNGLRPNLKLAVRTTSPGSAFPGVELWHPAPDAQGNKVRGWLAAVLPVDLAPRPGEELRIEVLPVLDDREGKVRFRTLRVMLE